MTASTSGLSTSERTFREVLGRYPLLNEEDGTPQSALMRFFLEQFCGTGGLVVPALGSRKPEGLTEAQSWAWDLCHGSDGERARAYGKIVSTREAAKPVLRKLRCHQQLSEDLPPLGKFFGLVEGALKDIDPASPTQIPFERALINLVDLVITEYVS